MRIIIKKSLRNGSNKEQTHVLQVTQTFEKICNWLRNQIKYNCIWLFRFLKFEIIVKRVTVLYFQLRKKYFTNKYFTNKSSNLQQ